MYGRLEWKAGKTYEAGLDSSAALDALDADEYDETRRTAQEVGRCEFVRRGCVMLLVVKGGKGGGEDAAGFIGGDMVGGDAVMAAIFALLLWCFFCHHQTSGPSL